MSNEEIKEEKIEPGNAASLFSQIRANTNSFFHSPAGQVMDPRLFPPRGFQAAVVQGVVTVVSLMYGFSTFVSGMESAFPESIYTHLLTEQSGLINRIFIVSGCMFFGGATYVGSHIQAPEPEVQEPEVQDIDFSSLENTYPFKGERLDKIPEHVKFQDSFLMSEGELRDTVTFEPFSPNETVVLIKTDNDIYVPCSFNTFIKNHLVSEEKPQLVIETMIFGQQGDLKFKDFNGSVRDSKDVIRVTGKALKTRVEELRELKSTPAPKRS